MITLYTPTFFNNFSCLIQGRNDSRALYGFLMKTPCVDIKNLCSIISSKNFNRNSLAHFGVSCEPWTRRNWASYYDYMALPLFECTILSKSFHCLIFPSSDIHSWLLLMRDYMKQHNNTYQWWASIWTAIEEPLGIHWCRKSLHTKEQRDLCLAAPHIFRLHSGLAEIL